MATAKSICWATDLGYLYVGRLKPLKLLFRLETGGEIVASPASMDPYLLVGSMNGNLYCIHEQSGLERWRHITGYPIPATPAVVGNQIFVTSSEPSLHVLDATTGIPQWTTTGITQFVALGKQHLYGTDPYGSLVALDAKTGGIVGRLPRDRGPSSSALSPGNEQGPALVNDQSDRIYLVSDTGLVQCLHERGLSEPIVYRQLSGDSEEGADRAAARAQDGSEALDQDASPFTEVGPARDDSAADTAPDTEKPTDTPTASDDPFGMDDNPFAD